MSTFSNENNSMRPLPASKGPISSFASDMEASMKSNEEESPDEVPKLPILADVDQELIKEAKISFQVPNPGFIFHNKLPKSGSTTMHNILTVLSQWNNFEHIKIDSAMMSFDDEGMFYAFFKKPVSTDRTVVTVKIWSILRKPMTVLKHHYWLNFTNHDMEPPTWINVMREPISWFESRFWFKRNGWIHKEGARLHENIEDGEAGMDIDMCIRIKHRQCTTVIWKYTRFFCGNEKFCEDHDEASKKKATEYSKQRLLNDYFLVGILEQFEDSLNLFEKVLPNFFRGARQAEASEYAKIAMNTTRTRDKKKMSWESREYLSTGPLKYEMDLYIFARALFNKKLRASGLQAENPTLWDAQHPETLDSTITMQDKVVLELASKSKEDMNLDKTNQDRPFR